MIYMASPPFADKAWNHPAGHPLMGAPLRVLERCFRVGREDNAHLGTELPCCDGLDSTQHMDVRVGKGPPSSCERIANTLSHNTAADTHYSTPETMQLLVDFSEHTINGTRIDRRDVPALRSANQPLQILTTNTVTVRSKPFPSHNRPL